MIRLFVGLALPKDITEQFASIGGGIAGARWTEAQSIHLTLRFIGDVDDIMFHDISPALAEIRTPSFELNFSGINMFGARRRRQTLWVGVEPNDALLHLQTKIESALVRLGLDPESRKFTPHVTLAHLRETPIEQMQDFIRAHSLLRAGPVTIDCFQLYSSHPSVNRLDFRIEEEFPLGDGASLNLPPGAGRGVS